MLLVPTFSRSLIHAPNGRLQNPNRARLILTRHCAAGQGGGDTRDAGGLTPMNVATFDGQHDIMRKRAASRRRPECAV